MKKIDLVNFLKDHHELVAGEATLSKLIKDVKRSENVRVRVNGRSLKTGRKKSLNIFLKNNGHALVFEANFIVLVFLLSSSAVFAEEKLVQSQDSAKATSTQTEVSPLPPAVQASGPYPMKTGPFDPEAGTHEWHVNFGEGEKVFTDQASVDAYVKEKMAKWETPFPELQKAAQAKADAEAEIQKAALNSKMQGEVDKAMKEGYIININNVEYGRPDSFAARAKSREYEYVDSQGGLYGFSDENGNPTTLDQYYQGAIKINSRMLEQNRKFAEEVRRNASPEEVKMNEPAFAEIEKMWKNAMIEAEAKYKEMAAVLKKTIPYDYKILDQNKGKMPADYWDTRPSLDLKPLDLAGYLFTANGGMIAPSGDVIISSEEIQGAEGVAVEKQNVGLSDIFSEPPKAERVEDKVAYSSFIEEKKRTQEAIEKKLQKSYAKSYKALVSLESKN